MLLLLLLLVLTAARIRVPLLRHINSRHRCVLTDLLATCPAKQA
jgi:hypothetical protein